MIRADVSNDKNEKIGNVDGLIVADRLKRQGLRDLRR
jgi:hypothetical protein